MILILLLSLAGLIDASYLSWEHFAQVIPPCTVNRFFPMLSDCGKVLSSSYSMVWKIPLALFGVFHYGVLLLAIIFALLNKNKIFKYWVILQSIVGALFSLYFMYLQLVVIKSICTYCTLSALISFTILVLTYVKLQDDRIDLRLNIYGLIYRFLVKPLLFLLDAEFIHETMIAFGAFLGNTFIANFFKNKFVHKNKKLQQTIAGIKFENPIGLAAGFDYDGRLIKILPNLDFGFHTIGTITHLPYEGNPPPRLGRLPRSKSLLVNKGFKNKGAEYISSKIKNQRSKIPLGISIGMTNSKKIKTIEDGVTDIKNAFKIFEKNNIKNSYYELNISCPNLINNKLNFYSPKNLNLLLEGLDKLRLKKPVFIKMPIDKTNREFLAMLKTIVQYKFIRGVIIGNLLKNRTDKSLDKNEVKKFKKGYFSGKPCEERSNELIALTHKRYRSLTIIGCGGIFNAQDAYRKIKLGASLVQLITGMIYEGPQLISQINLGLARKNQVK